MVKQILININIKLIEKCLISWIGQLTYHYLAYLERKSEPTNPDFFE